MCFFLCELSIFHVRLREIEESSGRIFEKRLKADYVRVLQFRIAISFRTSQKNQKIMIQPVDPT